MTRSSTLDDLVDAASASSSPPSREPVKRERDQRPAMTTRDRNKLERLNLRDTVATLERQLDEIKRDHHQRSPSQSPTQLPASTHLLQVWENLARSQCEQRYRAEVENTKLRKMLNDQVKVAQTLERILLKRRSSEQLFEHSRPMKRARSLGPMDDPDTLDKLKAMLPGLYDRIDTAFQQECFKNRREPFTRVELRHANSTSLSAEAAEFRILPFPLEVAAEALWEYLVFYPHDHAHEPDSEDFLGRDTLTRDICVGLKLEQYSGEMHIKCVARRYVEPARVVFVLQALSEPTDDAGSPLHGACQRHTGWYIIQRSAINPKITELLSTHVAAPEFHENPTDQQKRRLGSLANYITASLRSMIENATEVIDNRLMERTCVSSRMPCAWTR